MKQTVAYRRIFMPGLLGFLVWLAIATGGYAYFFDYGVGVRPTGMGQAFVAVADDANAVNYNPAGLATLERYELTMMLSSLFTGFEGRLYNGARDALGYSYVGVAVPVDPEIGYFGASWTQFGSYFYHENTFNVGYARTLTYKTETMHVGANLKILNWSVQGNDYTEPLSKTAFTADIAALYPLPKNFVAGLCIENIIPANVGLTTYEEVPRNFRLGASWSQDLKPLGAVIDNVLVSFELVNRSYMQNKNTVRFGAESWFFDGIAAARMGVNSTEFTISLSGKHLLRELNDVLLQVDYSFSLPFYIQDTYGSHRVALTASLPQPKGSKMERAEKALAEALKEETEENMAGMKDQELLESRKQEEAELAAMVAKLRAEILAVREQIKGIDVKIESGELPRVQFEAGKSVLKRISLRTLNEMGMVLEKYPQVKVRLEGHTDSNGKKADNLRLSQDRVEVVREYLVSLYKLKATNLIPVGYGETQPIASNKTPKGRAKNRRVEVHVLVPAGLAATSQTQTAPDDKSPEATIGKKDIVQYEEIEQLREKLKVYEMQMSTDEVEELFKQQHKNNGNGAKQEVDKPEGAVKPADMNK